MDISYSVLYVIVNNIIMLLHMVHIANFIPVVFFF